MVSIGNNIIRFRYAVKKLSDGTVIDQRLQVQTREVSASPTGLSLGAWSEWQDIDAAVVEVQEQ